MSYHSELRARLKNVRSELTILQILFMFTFVLFVGIIIARKE